MPPNGHNAIERDTGVSDKRFYNLRIWRDKIRPQKLRRDPLCEDCLQRGITVEATEVDHVDGNKHNNAPTNHRSLCKSCHSSKTVRLNGGLGRKPGTSREKGCDLHGNPLDENHPWNEGLRRTRE